MELKTEIINLLMHNGINDSEEYHLKMPKTDMVSELTVKGYSKEDIDLALEKLCTDGGLAMDEINIYMYDEIL